MSRSRNRPLRGALVAAVTLLMAGCSGALGGGSGDAAGSGGAADDTLALGLSRQLTSREAWFPEAYPAGRFCSGIHPPSGRWMPAS